MTHAVSQERLRRRDAFLTDAAADLLAHHERLAGLEIRASFDRGVAHLTGAVPGIADLARARNLIGRLDGVFAVWDRVRVAGREPVILDLGCGETPQYPTNIGIDRRPTKAVAAVAELAHGLPVRTGAADTVFAVHVLEHLADYFPLLDECHRALRAEGVLHVMTPWWRHVNAVADPTHLRLFDVQTIKSLCLSPPSGRRWSPLHVACDGASVFADLRPCLPGEEPNPTAIDRFFN